MPPDTKGKSLGAQIDDLLPKGDFRKALTIVLKNILAFQAKVNAAIDAVPQQIQSTVASLVAPMEQRIQTQVAQIVQGKNGRDGRDGVDGAPGKRGLPGKDGSSDTGEEVIGKINADKSKKKIKKEKIEGWKELEDAIKSAEVNSRYGLRAGGDTIYLADLSSQTDGLTKTFTIPQYRRIIMVVGSDFPSVLFNNNGFTAVQGTLTLTTDNAPSAGSQLGMQYVI